MGLYEETKAEILREEKEWREYNKVNIELDKSIKKLCDELGLDTNVVVGKICDTYYVIDSKLHWFKKKYLPPFYCLYAANSSKELYKELVRIKLEREKGI